MSVVYLHACLCAVKEVERSRERVLFKFTPPARVSLESVTLQTWCSTSSIAARISGFPVARPSIPATLLWPTAGISTRFILFLLSLSLSFSLCLFRYLPDLAWNWTKCNRSFATSKCVTWAALPLREELTSLEICCKATVPTVEEQTDFLKLRSLWVEFAYVRIGIELSSFESGSNEKTKEEKYIYMISVMDYFRLF